MTTDGSGGSSSLSFVRMSSFAAAMGRAKEPPSRQLAQWGPPTAKGVGARGRAAQQDQSKASSEGSRRKQPAVGAKGSAVGAQGSA